MLDDPPAPRFRNALVAVEGAGGLLINGSRGVGIVPEIDRFKATSPPKPVNRIKPVPVQETLPQTERQGRIVSPLTRIQVKRLAPNRVRNRWKGPAWFELNRGSHRVAGRQPQQRAPESIPMAGDVF